MQRDYWIPKISLGLSLAFNELPGGCSDANFSNICRLFVTRILTWLAFWMIWLETLSWSSAELAIMYKGKHDHIQLWRTDSNMLSLSLSLRLFSVAFLFIYLSFYSRIALLLRHLGFHAIPLHGQMSQVSFLLVLLTVATRCKDLFC